MITFLYINNLLCNGSEGLAIGVFVAGTIGIIIGLIFVIKAISRGKREKPVERPATNTSTIQTAPGSNM